MIAVSRTNRGLVRHKMRTVSLSGNQTFLPLPMAWVGPMPGK